MATDGLEVDVLVAGTGAGGLSAALYAAKAGLDVLVCEKTAQIGGTTATSGGGGWFPCSDQAKAAGWDDSPAKVLTYLRHELGNRYRADLAEGFTESAAVALRELETDTEVVFDLSGSPDYHPGSPGGLDGGRLLFARPWNARPLGAEFARVRPPMKRLMALWGMMVGPDELDAFLHPLASRANARRVLRKVLRYAADRLMGYARGTDVTTGNALVCRLFASLLARAVPVWTNAPLLRLERADDRVVAAWVQRDGRETRIAVRRGVVLATGGFPHNQDLVEEFAGAHPHVHSMAFSGNTGDGLKAAREVGAAVDTDLNSVALWTPASVDTKRDGSTETIIYGYLDRGKPGVIAVRPDGRRFVNESHSYHDIVLALYAGAKGAEPVAHFVCDYDFIRHRGLGMIRPWPFTPSLQPHIRSGYIQAADTIEDLARQIGADPAGLAETVARHNEFARTGRDLDFGKGETSYNRFFGDPAVKPNPNLAPIRRAPFVALRIHPASLGTCIGLKTTGAAQVVGTDGMPIAGLYACGNELASAMRGEYPSGGVTIGPAIVFAYRAVQHLRGVTA